MSFKSNSKDGAMDPRNAQRPRYIHKRQGSGSNETATLESLKIPAEATSTPVTVLQNSNVAENSAIGPAVPSSSFPEVSQAVTQVVAPSPSVSPEVPTKSSSGLLISDASSSAATDGIVVISTASLAPSSTRRSLIQGTPGPGAAPAPAPEPATTLATSLVPSIPVSSSETSAVSSPPESKPASSLAPAPTTPPAPRQTTQAPIPSASPSIGIPSSIIIDSIAATALSSSMSAPSILPISAPGNSPPTSTNTNPSASDNLAIQSGLAAATTSTGAAAFGAATNGPTSSPSQVSVGDSHGLSTAAIAGVSVGAFVGFALLAFLGVCCIRKRYGSSSRRSFSRFTSRPSSKLSVPESPPPMRVSFRPDPTSLFGNQRLSQVARSDTRTTTPDSFTSLVRHGRSHTISVLPPIVPARSVARPVLAPAPLAVQRASVHHEPSVSIDNSFMGTISTYIANSRRSSTGSHISSTPSLPTPLAAQTRPISHNATTNEYYTVSPYTSYLAPPVHNSSLPRTSAQQLAVAINTNNPFRRLPITNTITNAYTNPNIYAHAMTTTTTTTSAVPSSSTSTTPLNSKTSTILPPPPSSTPPSVANMQNRPNRTSSSPERTPPATSRFTTNIGPWRDSMWSTSATPIMQNPPLPDAQAGSGGEYFPTRPLSHRRGSRSLGDLVVDWEMDGQGQAHGEGVVEPPPRSPLRSYWPLGGGLR